MAHHIAVEDSQAPEHHSSGFDSGTLRIEF
jgi:hypothetical protein